MSKKVITPFFLLIIGIFIGFFLRGFLKNTEIRKDYSLNVIDSNYYPAPPPLSEIDCSLLKKLSLSCNADTLIESIGYNRDQRAKTISHYMKIFGDPKKIISIDSINHPLCQGNKYLKSILSHGLDSVVLFIWYDERKSFAASWLNVDEHSHRVIDAVDWTVKNANISN